MNNCLNKIKIVFGVVGPHSGMYINQIEKAPILKLDQLIKENNISIIDFLKIDIEGSEFDLLKNNNNWLKKVKKIAMEVHPSYGNPKELKDILEQNGFKCFFRDLNNKIVESIIGPDGEYLFANKTKN